MTSNSVPTSQRDALRKAIAERGAATEAVRVARDSADRSAEQVRTAERTLAAFGDVDNAILRHRAASFKNAAQGGPKPSLALPDDLLKKERGRDEAASAVAAVRVAHGSLVGELAEAQAALRKAERKVSELAGQVLVAETTEQGGALTDIWNSLWATIDMLNALRASLRIQLPREVVRTLQSFEAMDHRMFAGGRNDQLARAAEHWRSYHAALCESADATQPGLNNESISSAVINRVA